MTHSKYKIGDLVDVLYPKGYTETASRITGLKHVTNWGIRSNGGEHVIDYNGWLYQTDSMEKPHWFLMEQYITPHNLIEDQAYTKLKIEILGVTSPKRPKPLHFIE